MLDLFMTPFAALAEVAVVGAALPKVRHATHETAISFHVESATDVAESADRFRRIELPWVEPEMAVGQSPNGADRDAHPTRGTERLRQISPVGRRDGGLERPKCALDRSHADDLVADPCAPVAHDATVPLV